MTDKRTSGHFVILIFLSPVFLSMKAKVYFKEMLLMLSELCGMGKIRDTEKVWIAPDEIVN